MTLGVSLFLMIFEVTVLCVWPAFKKNLKKLNTFVRSTILCVVQ